MGWSERRSDYFWTGLAGALERQVVGTGLVCSSQERRLVQLRVEHGVERRFEGEHGESRKLGRHADFDLRASGKMLARCSMNVGLVRSYAAIAHQAGAQKGRKEE